MSFQRKVNKFVSTRFGFRNRRNETIREQLADTEFSVFSNNCIGGVFLHDAGKRFNSPLVNLSMGGKALYPFWRILISIFNQNLNLLKTRGNHFQWVGMKT